MTQHHQSEFRPIFSIWKGLVLSGCVILFFVTLYYLMTGRLSGTCQWMWPALFIPLFLFLLSIILGDVPARTHSVSREASVPRPSSREFDRGVIALFILFAGLIINSILLAFSLLLSAPFILTLLYGVYLALMLFEMPNSIRLFRFLQSHDY